MKKKGLVLAAGAIALLLAGWIAWGNLTVGVTEYEVTDARLPEAFNGFRIAVVSDLHDAEFGENNRRIAELIKKEKPDMIAITGDIVDSRRVDIGPAVSLVSQLTEIAPVYYVTGNHEAQIDGVFSELEAKLIESGATVLRDSVAEMKRGNDTIWLIGLDDPWFTADDSVDPKAILERNLRGIDKPDGYRILLSHRPEAFDVYASNSFNLALCGHTHGGQFRLPFIGGLYAPHQGFFPKYDAGVFTKNQTTMIISRGIGNSRIPIRLNNRPEIVIAELCHATS